MNPPRVPPSASGQLPSGAVQTPAGVFSERWRERTVVEKCDSITSIEELDAYRDGLRDRSALDTDAFQAIEARRERLARAKAALQARAKARGVTI